MSESPSQVVHVNVAFNPPEDWNFNPDTAPFRVSQGPGKLILHKSPASAAWRFESARVVDDTDRQFFVHPPGSSGNVLMIDNACTAVGDWQYQVTVVLNGQRYTSPLQPLIQLPTPPRIQNDASVAM